MGRGFATARGEPVFGQGARERVQTFVGPVIGLLVGSAVAGEPRGSQLGQDAPGLFHDRGVTGSPQTPGLRGHRVELGEDARAVAATLPSGVNNRGNSSRRRRSAIGTSKSTRWHIDLFAQPVQPDQQFGDVLVGSRRCGVQHKRHHRSVITPLHAARRDPLGSDRRPSR